MGKGPRISVIVPVYNDARYLGACLESVAASEYPDFETIVVNDASADDSSAVARRYACRVVDLPENRGVANARNRGAAEATGDILVFLDSDMVIERDTLARFARGYETPGVRVFHCQISPRSLTPGFTPALLALLHNYWTGAQAPHPSSILSWCFSIERGLFREVGGFNTNFAVAGGEEFELGGVLRRRGHTMHLDTSFEVHHHYQTFWPRFKKLVRRSYVYATIVIGRDLMVDRGHGTPAEAVDALLSLLGALSLCLAPLAPRIAWGLPLAALLQQLIDRALARHIVRRRGLAFYLRSIPVTYLWYLAMGCGLAGAVLAHAWRRALAAASAPAFLFSRTPPYVIFFVTARCNARCRHCFNWKAADARGAAPELSLEEIRKISAGFGRIAYMTFSGGEPSMRGDIAEIARVFRRGNRLGALNFITNGFDTERVVAAAAEIVRTCPGLRLIVSVSIDGVGPLHDEIRGTPGGFERLRRTVERLKELRETSRALTLVATTTYSKYNRDRLGEILGFVSGELGLEAALTFVRGDTRDGDAGEVGLDAYREACALAAALNARNAPRRDPYRLTGALNALCARLVARTKEERRAVVRCRAGTRLVEIGHDGTVFPCEMLPADFGNLRDHAYDIRSVLASEKARRFAAGLRGGGCFCTWECAMKNNLIYSPRHYPAILREWARRLFPRRRTPR